MKQEIMSAHADSDLLLCRMVEKLSGTLSAPQEQELDYQIQHSPELQEKWIDLQNRFSEEDRENGLARFMQPERWKAAEKRKPLPWRKTIAPARRAMQAAAMISGLILGGWLLFPLVNPGKPDRKTSTVQLQLPDGNTIDLSGPAKTIKLGNMTLQSTSTALSYQKDAGPSKAAPGINILSVPMGRHYKVHLPDSTVIWLNAATELRFPAGFSGNRREITVKGEAYFIVAKKPGSPFVVNTPHSSIQVLGTSFNVNAYESGAERVALLEGALKINTAHEQIRVAPGEEAVYQPSNGSIALRPFDSMKLLGWINGVYYFKDTPISEICQIFRRCYGIKIKIDNAGIANKRFTGVLSRKKPPLEFIQSLLDAAALDYYFDKNGDVHFKNYETKKIGNFIR